MTNLDAFVRLSSALTGFDRMELLGTGQAPAYFDWVISHADLFRLQEMWALARGTLDDAAIERLLADERLGAIAMQINFLWYTAQWKTPFEPGFAAATQFVSPAAYEEALVWRVVLAHPPGARQTGFGSWSMPPARE